MVLRYVYFDDMRHNLIVYFTITTIILYWGPENIMPSLKKINEAPIVNAPVGDIGGVVMTSKNGRNIFAYKGIPYAKPPIGELRFKRPQSLPEKSWKGVFDGRKSARKCVQLSGISFSPVIGEEDCLQLNVYVPQSENPPQDGFPVMVWIHGGGFVAGDGTEEVTGPGFLLDKDVILVTLNYRLGMFGFLTLGNAEISGNQGMWDQLEALKWVQKNIASFGGQRQKVTIFGESAGGWSISSHLASWKSKGHFSGAIVQSGPLDFVGLKADAKKPLYQIHKEFVEQMGCSSDKIVHCLQRKSVKELMSGLKMFDECINWPDNLVYPVIWAPTDDHEYAKESFFAKHPREIFNSGEFNIVPTMVGATKDEGLLYTANHFVDPNKYSIYETEWNRCASKTFLGRYYDELTKQDQEKLNLIAEYYFKDGFSFENAFQNWTDAFGDSGFLYGTEVLARQLSQKSPTFYYHFDHVGILSLADILSVSKPRLLFDLAKIAFGFGQSKRLGASHGDSMLHLFKAEMIPFSITNESHEKMVDLMVTLWTNFATYQDPTPGQEGQKWLQYGAEKGHTYVRLLNGKILDQRDPLRDSRLDFWRQKIFN